jgi:hypothetical protein
MKKVIKKILIVLGIVFAFYLLKSLWAGFSSTANPSTQIQKAKCLADCRKNTPNNNCDQYCLDQTLEQ